MSDTANHDNSIQSSSSGNNASNNNRSAAVDAPPSYIPYSGMTPSPSYSVIGESALPHNHTLLHYPQPPSLGNPHASSYASSAYQSTAAATTSRHQPSPEAALLPIPSDQTILDDHRTPLLYGHSLPTNYGSMVRYYFDEDGADAIAARERLPSYKVFSAAQSCHLNRDGQIVGVGPSNYTRRPRMNGGHRSASPSRPAGLQSVVYVPHIGMPSAPNGRTVTLPICPASRSTFHEFVDEYTCPGLTCAVCFFPLGVLCCYLTRERRCFHCGYRLESNSVNTS